MMSWTRIPAVLSLLLLPLVAGCGAPEQPDGARIAMEVDRTRANAPAGNAPAGNAPEANAPTAHAPAANAPAGAPKPAGSAVPVVIETSKGRIELELYPDKAPITVENFLKYARRGHYNGTIFHRVIPDFMIQGGGFTPEMQEKPTDPPIRNEATNGLENERGTIAMARTPDPHSATAQFFINVRDNDFLNHRDETPEGYGYAVFGRVTRGMEVVDAIARVPTTTRAGHENVPIEPVVIRSVTVKESPGR